MRARLLTVVMVVLLALAGVGPFVQLSPVKQASASHGEDLDYVYHSDGKYVNKTYAKNGTEVWNINPSGTSAYQIEFGPDGNLHIRTDSKIVEVTPQGNEINSISTEYNVFVKMDRNGNYYARSSSNAKKFGKLDPSGNILWTFTADNNIQNFDFDKNGNVYLATNGKNIRAISSDGTTTLWNQTGYSHTPNDPRIDYHGNLVFSSGNDLHKISLSDGSNQWSKQLPDGIDAIDTNTTGHIALAAEGASDSIDAYYFDKSGTEIWSVGLPYTPGHADIGNHGNIYFQSGLSDDVIRKAVSDGSQIWRYMGRSSSVEVEAGDAFRKQSKAINGQVTDQNGNPIKNATVEVYGVNYANVNPDVGQSKRDRAEELLSQAKNPRPNSWNPDLSLKSDVLEGGDGNTVLIHSTESWGIGPGWFASPDLSNPLLNPPAEETVVLSVWNPTVDPQPAFLRQDPVDRDLHGVTTREAIIIEQLTPTGEVKHRETIEESAFEAVSSGYSKTHYRVRKSLPPGFYRIKAKGSSVATTYAVGNTEQLTSQISKNLTDKADRLTSRANSIRDNLNDGKFTRTTVTTDSNGQFTADIPKNAKTIGMQVYRLDGATLTTRSDPTPSSVREEIAAGYNGSIYLSSAREYTLQQAKAGVNITAYEVSSTKYQDPLQYANWFARLQGIIENTSYADLSKTFGDRYQDLSDSELENRNEQLENLRDRNEALAQRVRELAENQNLSVDLDQPLDQLTREELKTRLAAMEQALAELQSQMETEPPTTTTGSTTISQTHTFAGELSKAGTTVLVTLANGSTHNMTHVDNGGYWSIDKRPGRGDQVVIEEYPIPNETAVANIEVLTVSEEGNFGRSNARSRNPRYEGDLPQIESLAFSTLRPGPSETVRISLNAESDSVLSLNDTTIYGPDGSQFAQPAIENNRTFNFTTNGAGDYLIEFELEDASGSTFVERISIEAGDQDLPLPAGVRVIEGTLGTFAMAGDGLSGAAVDIEKSGKSMRVTPVTSGSVPDAVHIYQAGVLSAAESTTTVRLAQGSTDGQAVQSHVPVVIHTGTIPEKATIYRGESQPIGESGATHYGSISRNAGNATIKSYTDTNGAVSIKTDTAPGRLERLGYALRLKTGWSLDALPSFVGPVERVPLLRPSLPLEPLIEPWTIPTVFPSATGGIAI